MLVAAAVCPHPPLLLRELSGKDDPVADLRADCVRAVTSLLAHDPEIIVVVGGDTTTQDPPAEAVADPRPFGGGRHGPAGSGATNPVDAAAVDAGERGLPLSLSVADRLLAEAGWRGRTERHAVAYDATPQECERLGADLVAAHAGRAALLVLGDGSARRGTKAPGYHDERAEPFDAMLVRALETGEYETLRTLDGALAEQLMVQGRAAFHVLGAAVHHAEGKPAATLHRADDPYGVLYAVATWSLTTETSARS